MRSSKHEKGAAAEKREGEREETYHSWCSSTALLCRRSRASHDRPDLAVSWGAPTGKNSFSPRVGHDICRQRRGVASNAAGWYGWACAGNTADALRAAPVSPLPHLKTSLFRERAARAGAAACAHALAPHGSATDLPAMHAAAANMAGAAHKERMSQQGIREPSVRGGVSGAEEQNEWLRVCKPSSASWENGTNQDKPHTASPSVGLLGRKEHALEGWAGSPKYRREVAVACWHTGFV